MPMRVIRENFFLQANVRDYMPMENIQFDMNPYGVDYSSRDGFEAGRSIVDNGHLAYKKKLGVAQKAIGSLVSNIQPLTHMDNMGWSIDVKCYTKRS